MNKPSFEVPRLLKACTSLQSKNVSLACSFPLQYLLHVQLKIHSLQSLTGKIKTLRSSAASLTWFQQVLKSLSVVKTFLITQSYIFPINEMSKVLRLPEADFLKCCGVFFKLSIRDWFRDIKVFMYTAITLSSLSTNFVLDSVYRRQVLLSLFKNVTKKSFSLSETANSMISKSYFKKQNKTPV